MCGNPGLRRSACVWCLLLLITGTFLGSFSGTAPADEIDDFYSGKRLIVVVGSSGGSGTYDAYARLLARHIVNHLPGAPSAMVQNKPGAGSITATNFVYNIAPQDGTVLLAPNRTTPFSQILGHGGAQFDSTKLNWLGSLYQAIGVLAVSVQSRVKTVADARRVPAIIGSTAPGTDSVVFPALLNNTIGTKFRIVQGYNGMDAIFLAYVRGEVEGQESSFETFQRKIPEWRTKTNVLVQFGLNKHPNLPDVPLVFDYLDAKWIEPGLTVEEAATFWRFILAQTVMGHPFAVGPDVPAKRVAALRAAFDAMIKDPQFIKEAEKGQLDLLPISGQEIETLVKRAAAVPKETLGKLQNEINYKGEK